MFFLFLISPKCLGLNDRFTYEYARLRCLFSSILSISLLMVIAERKEFSFSYESLRHACVNEVFNYEATASKSVQGRWIVIGKSIGSHPGDLLKLLLRLR